MAMVSPTFVDTLAPTVEADACVDCACEADCDDYDDVEAPLLVGLVIIFKQEFFSGKVLPKMVCSFQKNSFYKKS